MRQGPLERRVSHQRKKSLLLPEWCYNGLVTTVFDTVAQNTIGTGTMLTKLCQMADIPFVPKVGETARDEWKRGTFLSAMIFAYFGIWQYPWSDYYKAFLELRGRSGQLEDELPEVGGQNVRELKEKMGQELRRWSAYLDDLYRGLHNTQNVNGKL